MIFVLSFLAFLCFNFNVRDVKRYSDSVLQYNSSDSILQYNFFITIIFYDIRFKKFSKICYFYVI